MGGQRKAGQSQSDADETPRRADPRTSVFFRSDVEVHDIKTHGKLRNLSAAGARLELDVSPEIGDPIRLTIRNVGKISGRVVWARDGQVGVLFDSQIDPEAAYPVRRPAKIPQGPPIETDYKRPALGRFRLKS